jgi:hypothetical protein
MNWKRGKILYSFRLDFPINEYRDYIQVQSSYRHILRQKDQTPYENELATIKFLDIRVPCYVDCKVIYPYPGHAVASDCPRGTSPYNLWKAACKGLEKMKIINARNIIVSGVPTKCFGNQPGTLITITEAISDGKGAYHGKNKKDN